jgi:DNA modification methylase
MTLLKPYYQDSAVTLYHGDCREIVPLLGRFDLLLTDPPYGIGEGNAKRIASRANAAAARDYGHSEWDSKPPSPTDIAVFRAHADMQILWGGNYFGGLPPSRAWLVWDKDNGANDFADCELAWTNLEMAVRKFKWRWAGMLQENMSEKDVREHPTQKPLALMTWCLSLAGDDAQTVLDPFAGSGTTGRACKDLGRKCTMIEREERYCEIAARRMGQEVLALG